MTIDDFDIIVSTIPESDRLDRLFRHFYDAGITRWMLDYEPRFTGELPADYVGHKVPGAYGCGLHFCEIQAKFSHRNIIYFEDDAILNPDFCEVMNQHLDELPDDWKIFVAGYLGKMNVRERRAGENSVSEHLCRNVYKFWGTQCLVLRAGEWRNTLTDDIRSNEIYKYNQGQGFDLCIAQWARAKGLPVYFAKWSFVGQGDGMSFILNRYRKRSGT